MIRGTTAQFKFKLPYPKEELLWATIMFWQKNNTNPYLPITKKLVHCVTLDDPKELYVSLTADETIRFSEKYKAEAQLRAQHATTGSIIGCHKKDITVYSMKDEIFEEDPTMPAVNEDGWIILDGETIVD